MNIFIKVSDYWNEQYHILGFKTETSPDVDWIGNVFDIFATMYSFLFLLNVWYYRINTKLHQFFSTPGTRQA